MHGAHDNLVETVVVHSPRPPQVHHGRGAPRSPSTRLLPSSRFPRRAGPALRLARGALERRGTARRLTRA